MGSKKSKELKEGDKVKLKLRKNQVIGQNPNAGRVPVALGAHVNFSA